jgi:hypothetical protein
MKKIQRNILGYIFIALYVSYAASTSLFIHTHEYDGQQIVHSHPFLMGEGGALNHTHTAAQSIFIHYISSNLLLAISVSVGIAILFIYLHKEFQQETQPGTSRFMLYFSLRAPPVENVLAV